METKQQPPRVEIGEHGYQLKLTLALADRIQQQAEADLLADDANNVLIGLLFDQRKLAKVLWQFCKSQATELGIARERFDEDLDSDALSEGWAAVVDAVAFFIPSQRREAFLLAIETQMTAIDKGTAAIKQIVKSQATEQSIDEAISRTATVAQQDIAKALAASATS